MTKEYEQTMPIELPPQEVFEWVTRVEDLPRYLPPTKEVVTAGSLAAGTPGERVQMHSEIPDQGEFESEGYLSADEGARVGETVEEGEQPGGGA